MITGRQASDSTALLSVAEAAGLDELIRGLRHLMVIYSKWHNNYSFVLGQPYAAIFYKPGWLLIDGQLYRAEHFTWM
ncbi:hypothetical protein NYE44_01610 [Paenibacillus sp. FSL L8-0493]|uniref:hypothetical protein n=1 Tax=Paenibacillus sp. FSL L8-0493 TaxID=2975333 RepID=UPI0030FD593D